MPITRNSILSLVHIMIPALAGICVAAHAFPDRPLKLIVPYPAGGPADLLARSMAEHMRVDLGQAVVIDNKPGANTIIGAQAVMNAPADGHTLLLSTAATLVLNPLLYRKLPYDPNVDLTPVALVASSGLVMLVNPSLKTSSVAEFNALAKARAGRLNYASIGLGSSMHLASELYKMQGGVDMAHIPYSGSAPALNALLAGNVDIFFDAAGSALPFVQSGRLNALAVTTPSRLPALPNVPTVSEAGIPGYEASVWFGLSAPARTPPELIDRLNRSVARALSSSAFRQQFEALGYIIATPTPASAFATHVAKERERWTRVVKAKGITLD
jgi:tripartite-type tricarboxylate transporter receptor subunit TctC